MHAVAGFLGLATVLIPYTYWIHQKIKNKTDKARAKLISAIFLTRAPEKMIG